MKKDYLIIIPLAILSTIIILLLTEKIYLIDNVYNYIVIHNNYLTKTFKFITDFGSFKYILIICILLFFVIKEKRELLNLYSIIILSTILNNILKFIFIRPRPNLVHLVEENTYSFPSGHSMAAMTFYGYIIYMISISKLNKKWKWILSLTLSTLILVIGYSRVYLNVHYISDVLAGFMCSIILLYVFIKLQRYKMKK